MNKFYCRGEKTRIDLVKKYEIIPISHMPLLKGQKKRSATGDTIIKEYYCFSIKDKNSDKDPEMFIVGTLAAKHFLTLLKHGSLPIFHILKNNKKNSKGQKNNSTSVEMDKWNPLALELYKIINIILIAWDTNGGVLSKIMMNVIKNTNKEPTLANIRSINTIISKDPKKRTIYQILDEIKRQNEIKDFKFPLITKILLDNKIKNNITGENNG
jgi:hypothetical protein